MVCGSAAEEGWSSGIAEQCQGRLSGTAKVHYPIPGFLISGLEEVCEFWRGEHWAGARWQVYSCTSGNRFKQNKQPEKFVISFSNITACCIIMTFGGSPGLAPQLVFPLFSCKAL